MAFGLDIDQPGLPDRLLDENESIEIDGRTVSILSTPGHADGSICLHIPSMKMLFVGDVLFSGSIGRTDLPTGDMETLLSSIKNKIMVLDKDTKVFPGHGPDTTIGFEQQSNPYLQ